MSDLTSLTQETELKKYLDQYIAVASFDDCKSLDYSKIIASNKDLKLTYQMAVDKGTKDPVVFYYTNKPFVFYNSLN